MDGGDNILLAGWVKTSLNCQVPDIHSLSAFPPNRSGSEDTKSNDRSSSSAQTLGRTSSSWLSASKSQPVPTNASISTALADSSCQSQNLSLPNSNSSVLESGEIPAGMDYADGLDGKLTKAQKKNMKRAERKKKSAVSITLVCSMIVHSILF